jgi:hypothetical protein
MRITLVALASASLFQLASAQNITNVLTVTPSPGITAKAGERTSATLTVIVAPGYHANSDKPADAYLIPLYLAWNPGPLTAGSVVFPKASIQKLGFSAKPVSVFTGAFDIVTQFRVASDAVPGPSRAVGKLHYQACDNRSCLPPATIEVSVPVVIRK